MPLRLHIAVPQPQATAATTAARCWHGVVLTLVQLRCTLRVPSHTIDPPTSQADARPRGWRTACHITTPTLSPSTHHFCAPGPPANTRNSTFPPASPMPHLMLPSCQCAIPMRLSSDPFPPPASPTRQAHGLIESLFLSQSSHRATHLPAPCRPPARWPACRGPCCAPDPPCERSAVEDRTNKHCLHVPKTSITPVTPKIKAVLACRQRSKNSVPYLHGLSAHLALCAAYPRPPPFPSRTVVARITLAPCSPYLRFPRRIAPTFSIHLANTTLESHTVVPRCSLDGSCASRSTVPNTSCSTSVVSSVGQLGCELVLQACGLGSCVCACGRLVGLGVGVRPGTVGKRWYNRGGPAPPTRIWLCGCAREKGIEGFCIMCNSVGARVDSWCQAKGRLGCRPGVGSSGAACHGRA